MSDLNNNVLSVTSLAQLSEYANGKVVELPPFAEDQPFVARLRRPSLMSLAKAGQIPNTLLEAANSMFLGKEQNKKRDPDSLSKMLDVIEILCEAAFVEPTYDQIKTAGVKLTDEQLVFVFTYTQKGVASLQSFREEQGRAKNHNVGEVVQ